jgi:hypothetical protein
VPQLRLDDWDVDAQDAACQALIARVKTARGDLTDADAAIEPLVRGLAASLPPALELTAEPAPRFWSPTDPVVLIGNYGKQDTHASRGPLPCRLISDVAVAMTVEGVAREFRDVPWSRPITQRVAMLFPQQAPALTALTGEAARRVGNRSGCRRDPAGVPQRRRVDTLVRRVGGCRRAETGRPTVTPPIDGTGSGRRRGERVLAALAVARTTVVAAVPRLGDRMAGHSCRRGSIRRRLAPG